MTAPGGNIGSLYVSVRARTDQVEPDIRDGLNRASGDVTGDLDRIGRDWGDRVSHSTSDEISRHGNDFSHSIERSMRGKVVEIKGVKYKIDQRGLAHIFEGVGKGRFADKIIQDMVRGFEDASGPGGVFSKVGEGIADAVGSGFNVPSKSPLMAVLIPAFGALGALIGAAIQGIGALIGLLFTIPTIVTGIGLSVGVVMLAFHGLGNAIGGAFQAKNAKELNAAIKDLAPSAQAFVKSLLPLRDLFKELRAATQEAFFKSFGDTVTIVAKALGPILDVGLPKLATAVGSFFRGIGIFFQSPVFQKFLSDVIPATIAWLNSFSPALISLLSGLIKAADASIPFLKAIGDMLNGALLSFSTWLQGTINDGSFQKWLAGAEHTLELLFQLGGAITDFFFTFIAQLDKVGGDNLIGTLILNIQALVVFLKSPLGENFLLGLIHVLEILTFMFTGTIITIGVVIALIDGMIRVIGMAIGWIVNVAWPWIIKLFEGIRFFFEKLWFGVQVLWDKIINWLSGGIEKTAGAIKKTAESVGSFFRDLPAKIVGWVTTAITSLGDIGYRAGRNLISNLISGIRNMLPDLNGIASSVARALASWLPGSPARIGPLSGEGWTYRRGQRMMSDFSAGIVSQNDELSASIGSQVNSTAMAFATGAFQLNFKGALPSDEQAYGVGTQAARGFIDQIGARNTRLAVRIA